MEKKVAVKEFNSIIDGDNIGYEATVILQYLDTFGVSEDDYTKDLGWNLPMLLKNNQKKSLIFVLEKEPIKL